MQGSLFPDGVTVDHVALRRTEITKAAEILRNRVGWTSRGILSGGGVSVNRPTPPTLNLNVNISPFAGFVPNGEYIECPVPYGNVALSAYNPAGTVNYVGVMYSELNTHSQPHESNQNVYPTFAEMAWRVSVYTDAEFALLPVSDSNLANPAQNRFLLLAKVTSRGSSTSLEDQDIEGPISFNNLLYSSPIYTPAPVPPAPAPPSLNEGIRIKKVSQGTAVGTGTIAYTYLSTGEPKYQFTWTPSNKTAPGVPGPPAPYPVQDGIFNLYDVDGVEYIAVELLSALLPLTDTTALVDIISLYSQSVPRNTAEDTLHRNMIGSGLPTPTNPHGMTVDDLDGQDLSVLNEHQNVMHCNGIARISDVDCLKATVVDPGGTNADTLSIVPPAGSDTFYVNGKKFSSIYPTNGSLAFSSLLDLKTRYYEIYVSDDKGSLEYSGSLGDGMGKAVYPSSRECTGTWIIGMSDNYPAGDYKLKINTSLDSGTGVYTWAVYWGKVGEGYGSPVSLTSNDDTGCIRLYDSAGVRWIDLWMSTTYSVGSDKYPPTGLGDHDDTITVRASYTEGSDAYMKIAGVSYWHDNGKWWMGYDPAASGRKAVDLRIWGNTCSDQLSTQLLESLIYEPLNTQGRSGCLMARTSKTTPFQVTEVSNLLVKAQGGIYYVRGKRVVVESSQTLPLLQANKSYLIWADEFGVYQTKSVSGQVWEEFKSILGSSYDLKSVSPEYHLTLTNYAPENGVIIAFVKTGAASVDYIEDFTQNINQVDNPWSVGRRTSVTRGTNCAYDNLHAAFSYAKYAQYTNTCRGHKTITIEGETYLSAAQITQPPGIIVKGCGTLREIADSDDVNSSVVRVYNSNASPIWIMSAGCKIQDLSFYAGSNDDENNAYIRVNSDTEISGCSFFSAVGDNFRTFLDYPDGVSTVKILNNIVRGKLFAFQGADSGGRFTITGNTFIGIGGGESYNAVPLYQVTESVISNNTFYVDANGFNSYGIYLTECNKISVVGNIFELEDSTPLNLKTPIGIRLSDSNNIVVTDNSITRNTLTERSLGVLLDNTYLIKVDSNVFNALGVAVRSYGDIRNVSISHNQINNIYTQPIIVEVCGGAGNDDDYGIRIDGNILTNTGLLYVSGDYMPSSNHACINVYRSASATPDKDVRELSICNNIIEEANGNDAFYAIRVSVDAVSGRSLTLTSSKINGNTINGISTTVNGESLWGILIDGTYTDPTVFGIFITR